MDHDSPIVRALFFFLQRKMAWRNRKCNVAQCQDRSPIRTCSGSVSDTRRALRGLCTLDTTNGNNLRSWQRFWTKMTLPEIWLMARIEVQQLVSFWLRVMRRGRTWLLRGPIPLAGDTNKKFRMLEPGAEGGTLKHTQSGMQSLGFCGHASDGSTMGWLGKQTSS